MSAAPPRLLDEYVSNLRWYLEGGGEAALQRAYEVSREAMAEGMGVLEMAAVHHEALARVMPGLAPPEAAVRALRAAETFLVESLSPFEMTHRAFRESNDALVRLNEKLEQEAKRIAHALHDEAGQLLASVHIALDMVSHNVPPEVRPRLSEVGARLDQVSQQLRHLSHELRPTILDDLGLLPALRFLAEGVSGRSSIPVAVEGRLEGRLPPAVETAIYRAVQEALINTTKHAHATRATIEVRREPGRIRCLVKDNGAGFDAAAAFANNGGRGLGLVGIRERLKALQGALQITSASGRGTDLLITIPLED